MSDRIHIHDLALRTIIGVHDWERETKQDVLVNLVIEADLARAAASDELTDSVDYRDLTKRVIAHVEKSQYLLIERLAGSIADLALEHFPAIRAITVKVDKPGALRFARSVGVEMRRERA